jgi:peptidyl-prolyl cis-trans isomerase C
MKHTLINSVPEPAASPCSVPRRAHATLVEKAAPIRVNGVEVEENAIAREAQHHPAQTAPESRAMAARALVIRTLLLQRARELGLSPAPEADGGGRLETEEEALIRQVIEREAVIASPSEDECRRYYQAAASLHVIPFEAAVPQIRDRLKARAWITGSSRYVAQLARAARIEGVEL